MENSSAVPLLNTPWGLIVDFFVLFKKCSFDPDPELPEKSDPENIFWDTTHCNNP